MRLRLTVVHDPGSATARDGSRAPVAHEVEVDAPQGSTAAELAAALAGHVGAGRGMSLSARGIPIGPTTRVGTGPLLDGAALLLAPQAAPTAPSQLALAPLTLVVSHGPDAGHAWSLTPGRRRIGRSEQVELSLDDPSLSRVHLEVVADAESIVLRDLGSTNGTRVNGRLLGIDPRRVEVGSEVVIGDTELTLRERRRIPTPTTPGSDGTRLVTRRPRPRPVETARTVSMPAPPEPPPRSRAPWVAIVLPIPVAAVMALFVGPVMLAFALMSRLMAVATAVSDRVGGRRRYAAALAEHAVRLREAHVALDAACLEERAQRRQQIPDLGEVLEIAAGPGSALWDRRPSDAEWLVVGVGTCSAPATVELVGVDGRPAPGLPILEGVPSTLSLMDAGTVGICGDRDDVLGAARAILGQLMVSHSPRDLSVAVVTGAATRADWDWLARMPHARSPDGSTRPGALVCLEPASAHDDPSLDALRRDLARRAEPRVPGEPRSRTGTLVVLLDGATALRTVTGLPSGVGGTPVTCCLALDTTRERLPPQAGAVLDLRARGRPVLEQSGSPVTGLVVDGVGAWWSERLSRSLAPLRDPGPASQESTIPDRLDFADLVPAVRDVSAVSSLWQDGDPVTAVPVGHTGDGTFCIDLRHDGPHVLVGGTTGSGKSEFLRTLVISLATHHSPHRLSLVLIDYKGGSAFGECASLPHTAGLVTDLDQQLADRVLVSLRAELARRETLFAARGVGSYDEYVGANPHEPLTRLVIVIDEFRALVDELPAFVDGVVRLAALGRSLGIHVVLATQRPSGVISAEIRANVNLRIALRVRDRSDSDDIIDAPQAALLSARTPGRGLARAGSEPLVAFQTAQVGAPAPTGQPGGIRVRNADWRTLALPWPPMPGPPPSDHWGIKECVATLVEASRRTGLAAPAPPWLPPLPAAVRAESLAEPASVWEVPIGLLDLPAQQAQVPFLLDLRVPGHWALIGSVGSGRTTALESIARGLASRREPTSLHVVAVSGGGLRDLETLPHCAVQVGVDDRGRLRRLAARLARELSERRSKLAASGHQTMREWYAAEDPDAPPPLLLLIDDWELLAPTPGAAPGDPPSEQLVGLIRDGEALGLKAIVAGDRTLLVGSTGALFAQRLLLRSGDPTDWLLAGISPRQVPSHFPTGRALLPDATELQLALPTQRPPRAAGTAGGTLPWRVDALPTQVRVDGLRLESRHGRIVVGVGGDECGPVWLDEVRDGRQWLIAGAPGSGVSSLLLLISQGFRAAGRPVAFVSGRQGPLVTPLGGDASTTWCTPEDGDTLDSALRAHRDLVVVVDEAQDLVDTPCEAVIRSGGRSADPGSGLVVCGVDATALATQYRGLAVEVARRQVGVLLGPRSTAEAALLGQRLPVDPTAPRGRGYLISRGQATPMQALLPDE